jgi:hypothetical protein
MMSESNGVLDSNLLLSVLLGSSLLNLYAWHTDFYTICDSILADIPDTEDRSVHWGPQQHRRIADFNTDDNARSLTRFSKTELYELLQLFDFPCNAHGIVSVPCGPLGLSNYDIHR